MKAALKHTHTHTHTHTHSQLTQSPYRACVLHTQVPARAPAHRRLTPRSAQVAFPR